MKTIKEVVGDFVCSSAYHSMWLFVGNYVGSSVFDSATDASHSVWDYVEDCVRISIWDPIRQKSKELINENN